MASRVLTSVFGDAESIPGLSANPLPYVVASLLAVLLIYHLRLHSELSIINPKKPFELSDRRVKRVFAANARKFLTEWFDTHPDKPLTMNADYGRLTVLPPHMANEIRNHKSLSFTKWSQNSFHAHLPGFDGFREITRGKDDRLVNRVLNKELNKQLAKVMEPLAEETALSLNELFTDDTEWHTINPTQNILRVIARGSSRVLLGEQLCRNEAWLRVTREYTVAAFQAAAQLRLYPAWTRPLVHWFLPPCRQARAMAKVARSVIQPVIDERKRRKLEAEALGKKPEVFDDAIEWFEKESKDVEYDAATVQLVMSLAAIHTTTDLTCQTLTDIARNPHILKDLREEIISVLREDGWGKTTLYRMKLLDSVIKESQRLKPIAMATMRRVASETFTLSDGTVIPKGHSVAVSSHSMWEPQIHPQPNEWNGYRFYDMRDEPEKQHLAQLVTTGISHLAWGHGDHACPGRFFAANEVKIILVHILLKYDFELPAGYVPKVREWGFAPRLQCPRCVGCILRAVGRIQAPVMAPQQPEQQPAGVSSVPAQLIKPWKLPPQKKYIFKNANVVDPVSGTVVEGQTVGLSGGLIESLGDDVPAPSGYVVVDLSGKYLCPGLIDCHVHLAAVAGSDSLAASLFGSDPAESHFRQPFLCRQMLSRGFTTVRDTGGATLALKEALDDDVFAGPRLVLANKALSQTGGHGDARGPHQPHQQCCGGDTALTTVVDGVPACIHAARDQMRTGADFIKIIVGGGVASPTDRLENTQFTADEIRAIADVAESYGTYVTAHAYTPKAIRHAVDNGVMCIEHGNFLDDDTARYMAARGVWLVPTLITYQALGEDQYGGFLPPVNRAKNREVLARGLGSLRIAEAAGVRICHGSDLLGPLQAEQSREFGLRAQALSSAAVLRGATVTPARLLKQDGFLGQVKTGFAADLLVLNGNPLEDASVLAKPERSVLAVMKNGRVYTSRWQKLPEDVGQATALIE
ncbi:Dihydromonacolin L monooxygenase LovA [Tolypocladium ophioglossoides CBS 100239]|uniref:Dihydromonacolin L monooxygenase LovA n=1 Tax=Tolypocladium ophioglossoides (strain CBS 100239) TaxID=1163406 RepID=A0A0L0N0Y6_TOLOC|nr:Dihydromonacolin L monooxygenase LovA [Tolypocladium ophioglossoides CBS 100239]